MEHFRNDTFRVDTGTATLGKWFAFDAKKKQEIKSRAGKISEQMFSNSTTHLVRKKKSQPWRRFVHLVFLTIDFNDFSSQYTPQFLWRYRNITSNTQASGFMGYPNISNFVKNTSLHVVLSTLFSVIGYPSGTLSLVFDALCPEHAKKAIAFLNELRNHVKIILLLIKSVLENN